MYIVIRKDKSEKLEEKLRMIKRCVAEVMECFEESKEERYEQEDYRDNARGGGGMYRARGREEDYYDEEDYRNMARGRSGGSYSGRGRY